MTQAVSHGFPDWGRQMAASDITILNDLGVNIAGPSTRGTFFVGNMPFLQVQGSAFVSFMKVGFDWSSDAAGTLPVGRDVIATDPFVPLNQAIPVRGPYVKISVALAAYPNQFSLQVIMQPERSNEAQVFEGYNTIILADAVVLAAGANTTLTPAYVRGGWVHWNVALEFGVNYLARLYALGFPGTLQLLDVITQGQSRGSGMVFAPCLPLRVTIQNNDGVGRVYYATVTHHPFWS